MLKNGPRGWVRAVRGHPRPSPGLRRGWDGREGVWECNSSLMIFIGSEISFGAGAAGAGAGCPITSGNVRRDEQGTMKEERKEKKNMKTLTESSGQLTAHGHGGTIVPRSNVRTDNQQKTEVSSTADRSPSGSGRASELLGRTSPMRWDDISPHKGYMNEKLERRWRG